MFAITNTTIGADDTVESQDYCPICNEPADGCELRCDICKQCIHDHCSGLQRETVTVLLSIIQQTGWTCINCRSDCKDSHSKITDLQCKLSQIVEHLSGVLQKVDTLERKLSLSDEKAIRVHHQSSQLSEQLIPTNDRVTGSLEKQHVAIDVHRVLADACRRKKNVIVSGLPEASEWADDTTVHDERTFLRLCEKNLSIKPAVSKLGCNRLGDRRSEQRPRKLLVHLESESAAADLLREAKRLRQSHDVAVATSVYINPDLSPAERKLAYTQRQQRRAANRTTRVKSTLNAGEDSTANTNVIIRHEPVEPNNTPFRPVVVP